MSLVNNAAQPAAAEAALPSLASTASTTALAAKPKLDTLPTEVLLQVWVHLDEPVPFAWANKRFHALSKDTLWRAKWFMQRYELYQVLFQAIARSRIFTVTLFRQLVRFSAPLSVNLVQLLYIVHNEVSEAGLRPELYELGQLRKPGCWGHIPFSAYNEVMSWALKLYGEDVTFELENFHSARCMSWMEKQTDYVLRGGKDPMPCEAVRDTFRNARFMPLDLNVESQELGGEFLEELGFQMHGRTELVTRAILLDPSLLEPALSNGYELNQRRSVEIINHWCMRFLDVERIKTFAQKLKVDGVLHLSALYVKWVFTDPPKPSGAASKPVTYPQGLNAESSAKECMRSLSSQRNLLLHFDRELALPFRLHDVVEGLSAPLTSSTARKRKASVDDETEELKVDDTEEQAGVLKRKRARIPA